MTDILLFVVFPYVALAIGIVAPLLVLSPSALAAQYANPKLMPYLAWRASPA